MTTQPAVIDYASPGPGARPGKGHALLAAALAVAVGFLGANAFADAAGFPAPEDSNRDAGYVALRVLCGVVVFAVAFVVLAFVFREVRALAHSLARSPVRPAPPVALACVICGTACVLVALAVQVYAMRNPTVVAGPGFRALVQTPIMVHLVTLMAFVLGAGLIGVGVWSSMAPRVTTPPTPPSAP